MRYLYFNIINFIIYNQVTILSEITHKSMIKINFVNLNGEYRKYYGKVYKVVYYVMKIADYGELYKFLEITKSFKEKYARFYFK